MDWIPPFRRGRYAWRRSGLEVGPKYGTVQEDESDDAHANPEPVLEIGFPQYKYQVISELIHVRKWSKGRAKLLQLAPGQQRITPPLPNSHCARLTGRSVRLTAHHELVAKTPRAPGEKLMISATAVALHRECDDGPPHRGIHPPGAVGGQIVQLNR